MAKAALGAKRVCVSCTARFYDLNKRPIECPKCGARFEPEVLLRTRRPRTPDKKDAVVPVAVDMDDEAVAADKSEDAEESEQEAAPAEEVSLEEAAEAEAGDDAAEDEGAGVIEINDDEIEDDDDDEDDELIEELEDEDAEIEDIIDTDIEDEKER